MKHNRLLLLLVLLGLVLAAAPALAGTVSMNQTYDLTLTFTGTGIGGGTVSSYAYYLQGINMRFRLCWTRRDPRVSRCRGDAHVYFYPDPGDHHF